MSDVMTQEVKDIVDSIFKQQEESEMRKETEEALRNSRDVIGELNKSLEDKDVELDGSKEEVSNLNHTIEELNTKVSELNETITTLEQEKSGFESKKAVLVKRAESAEEDLESMKKDQVAKVRFEDLKSAGIASSNDESQIVKVREMSDEEFSAYKDELLVIRESIIAELNRSNPGDDSNNEVPDESAGADEEGAELSENDEEDAAGSEDTINPIYAAIASFNMEVSPSSDVVTKYKELGDQMAKNMAGDN